MAVDTLDMLKTARAYIARGWTQGVYARDAAGHEVSSSSEEASCWCIYGALGAAENAMKFEYDYAATALARLLGTDLLSIWNDTPGRTQAEVLEAFDKAIAAEASA